MEISARLYNCARCHQQAILCSHCDHDNIYCFDGCAQEAGTLSLREASKRYRKSPKGLLNAASRQAEFRRRKRLDESSNPSSDSPVEIKFMGSINANSPMTLLVLPSLLSSFLSGLFTWSKHESRCCRWKPSSPPSAFGQFSCPDLPNPCLVCISPTAFRRDTLHWPELFDYSSKESAECSHSSNDFNRWHTELKELICQAF